MVWAFRVFGQRPKINKATAIRALVRQRLHLILVALPCCFSGADPQHPSLDIEATLSWRSVVIQASLAPLSNQTLLYQSLSESEGAFEAIQRELVQYCALRS